MIVFTEKDFNLHEARDNRAIDINGSAAMQANSKLYNLLVNAPIVFGMKNPNGWYVTECKGISDTHKGVLMFLEEIPKEPCKHEPLDLHIFGPRLYCKHCKVELVAEFKVKDV